MAASDLVMLWGRFSGHGAGLPGIVVNIIRMEDGLLKEHWDVIEDEVTRANSLSGIPMFGDTFWRKLRLQLTVVDQPSMSLGDVPNRQRRAR